MEGEPADRLDEARAALAVFGRRMIADGLAVGSAGNLSVRVDDVVAITPSGVPYHEIAKEQICVISPDGEEVGEQPCAVSSEAPLHCTIYRSTRARAVVHTHSPEVVALSSVLDELPAIHYAIVALGGPVRVAPYTRFGSQALADIALRALEGRAAVILQNHGAVTHGQSLAEAYSRAELLEWLAQVYRKALQLGAPRILSEGELEEVKAEARRRRMAAASPPASNGGGR